MDDEHERQADDEQLQPTNDDDADVFGFAEFVANGTGLVGLNDCQNEGDDGDQY